MAADPVDHAPEHPARPTLRQRARLLKRDVLAIYLAARDPRTPWYARLLAVLIAGYALSPIDLIPDFIPVLGYLDDVILLPAGILLVRRMIPEALLAEHRAEAERIAERPTSRTAALVIAFVWVVAVVLLGTWLWPLVRRLL